MPVKPTITVVGEERVKARFERFGRAVRQRLREAVYLSGVTLQRHVMDEKLSGQVLNVRTGILRSSIALDPPSEAADEGDRIFIRVGTNKSYGIAWELGNPDHEIGARRKKALRWFGSDGKPVFRRRVFWRTAVHQRPFLLPSFEELRGDIRERLRAAIEEAGGDVD